MSKEALRRYLKARYIRLVAERKCVRCKAELPASATGTRCATCREKARLYAEQCRQKEKLEIIRRKK